SAHISFSGSGRQMAYIQRTGTANLHRVGFDPSAEIAVGQPEPITQGSHSTGNPAVSPNGEWLAFNDARKKDDGFVVRNDGSGLRQLTDDAYYHRQSVWRPMERSWRSFPIAAAKSTYGRCVRMAAASAR